MREASYHIKCLKIVFCVHLMLSVTSSFLNFNTINWVIFEVSQLIFDVTRLQNIHYSTNLFIHLRFEIDTRLIAFVTRLRYNVS